MASATKYAVVQYADGLALTIDRQGQLQAAFDMETQRDRFCGFDSIAEAVKGIIGAGDYIIAVDDGVVRPLNRKEQHEFDRLRDRP